MKKLMVTAIAVMAMFLVAPNAPKGDRETKEGWPACAAEGGPSVFRGYILAIVRQDEFAISFYQTTKHCGAFKGGMQVEVLKQGDGLILVRVHPEGHDPSMAFTVPEALKE